MYPTHRACMSACIQRTWCADVFACVRVLLCAAGMMSAFATRMMGSQDLFAARWDGGLPGGLAAGRRPAFGINALEPPLACDLLTVAGADEDPARAEIVARSLLLAMLVAQVRRAPPNLLLLAVSADAL